MSKTSSDNCMVCSNEFDDTELFSVRASSHKICAKCLASSDPQNDYAQVKNIVSGYLKFSQQMDAEVSSPAISVEPADTYIQKAVELLKQQNPNYFVGVRKIVVDSGQGFGHVASGKGEDPAVIHINLSKIKSELKSKLSGASPEQFDKELVRQIALVVAHEKSHQSSYTPNAGFGSESDAESAASAMDLKLNKYYENLK